MRRMEIVVIAILVGVSLGSGCQSAPKPAPKPTLLPVPGGTNTVAARHSDEGIQAYQQGQWAGAQQHFEAAIQASPELAEAHYNLGMTLYRIGAIAEGNSHFIKAADLAPGNKIIWDSPPLRNVNVPDKETILPRSSDGHMHSH